jgi:PAS domain S-box-containing protein
MDNPRKKEQELVEERTTKLTKTNKQLKQEIDERNKAEIILKEQAQIISQIHDAVVMTDMTGFVTFWNKGAENLFGYKAKEIYNRHISFLYRKEDQAILYNDVLVPLKEKGNHELELKQIKKSGEEIIVHLSLSLIRDSAGNIKGMASSSTDVTEHRRAEEALRNALNEVEQLKNRLQAENIYLQDEIKTEHNFEEIISRGKECQKVLHKVEQVATTDATVLLQGETGTGKELLARAIHNTSKRHNRPLVKINCAAIPVNLIESELFGHEKGAFTGALEKKIGRFELADKGTIFLDEIGELPLELQSKLLRVLQEGEFERLGNPRTIKVDARVIAATNRDLEKALKTGSFRQDLYYRLNVFPIKCPPLRERKEDIPLLVNHFIKRFCAKLGKKIETVPLDVMTSLQDYHWPGNVRELENVIERAVILSEGSTLRLDELFDRFSTPLDQVEDLMTVKEAEKSLILKMLEETNWMVGGKRGAAARLGIAPSTLRDRIKKFDLKRPL